MTELEWLELFGDNLASLLIEADMTQAELAEITGMSKATINKYIHGFQMPTAFAIVRLAAALDCNPSELIDFE